MRIRETQQSDAAAMARVIVDNYRSAHRLGGLYLTSGTIWDMIHAEDSSSTMCRRSNSAVPKGRH